MVERGGHLLALWVFTGRAGRALRSFNELVLDQARLDHSDFGALVVLWSRGEPWRASLRSVARDIGLSQSGATRVVQRLAQRGLVVKHADPDDGRAIVIEITAAGRRTVDELLALITTSLGDQLATSGIDVEQLAAATAELTGSLTAALGHPGRATPPADPPS
jgi:DNA-binding MarR family transcriptional regulator